MSIESHLRPVNPLHQTGHVEWHNALHAAYNEAGRDGLGQIRAGDSGHNVMHALLKQWYDAEHYTPLVEVRTLGDHLVAHEMLHAWQNGTTLR